jgi:3-hydroxyacyl-[acyl-carrier-protein] dehydratase
MKFALVDRIICCVPGERISTVKALSLAEEYLADHFPAFPVLPGVLMLEAMTQSAGWLVRATYDFEPVLIEMVEARNMTFLSFIRPGELLELEVVAKRMAPEASDFVGTGRCDGRDVVKAQFSLSHSTSVDEAPVSAELVRTLRSEARAQFELLGGPAAMRAEHVGRSAAQV